MLPWICVNVHVYGVQLLLPEGIKRENNKMYEEVEIPPNDPKSLGMEEKPIYISQLDEVRNEVYNCRLKDIYISIYIYV